MADLISETTKSALESSPGRSLIHEVSLLREQVQQLCSAVRQLVQLQAVANQKLDAALSGKPIFDTV